MKKTLLTIALLTVQLALLNAQTGLDKSATQIAAEMMPGWNLGNTMEAAVSWGSNPTGLYNNNSGLASETAWQGTRTTQAVIDYVKSCGFRSVRIPCAWVYGHISDAETCTIDAAWMARVKEIVDYCINDGLYVLLNDHWDGGWLENNINATGSTKTKNKEVLHTVWTQIANEFKDYDEHLIFGGLNEPGVEQQSVVANLVEYEQVFIDAVRATGGNNAKRLLVVQGPSTDAEKTCNWMKSAQMATDPIGNKLAVEVHLYYPWNFWGMTKDESWGNMFYYWGNGNHVSGSTHNATYGEENDLKNLIDQLKTTFVDHGIPVINGEYGIIWRTITGSGESQEKHNASIKAYYKTMNQLCMERGIVPFAWDTNSTGANQMTIINRATLTIYNNYMLDGIHEAMEAVGIPTAITSVSAERPAEPLTASATATPSATASDYYDLQGRTVPHPTHGLYIHNSRKLIVK